MGAENVVSLRKTLDVNTEPFDLGKDVIRDLVFLRKRFNSVEKTFNARIKAYKKCYPGDYKLLQEFLGHELNFDCLNDLTLTSALSGRELGGLVLNKLAETNLNIICSSADLFSSTKACITSSGEINSNFGNRNLKCGIREFAMGAISNGIALYGGLIPVQSTFMVFSDYLKNALRLTSMMHQKVISIFTHDSIAVGEDGATHQCAEQLWGLRAIPNTYVFRPANLNETIASYRVALNYSGSSVMALSRQKLTEFTNTEKDARFGGYVVSKESKGKLDGVIIATGSEVGLALDVKHILNSKGYNVRVVSMPCIELFDQQSEKYKNDIIPNNLKSVFSIEAGATTGWYKYVGKYGKCFGVDDFGMSAKPEDIYARFGLTSDNISKDIIKIIKRNKDEFIS